MTDLKKVLASNIKTFRKEKGLSQARLAEKIGIATHYLGMIETCNSFPSAEMIERIAVALEKDTLDFFSLTPIQREWKEIILSDMGEYVDRKLNSRNRP